MSKHIPAKLLQHKARILKAPEAQSRVEVDRSFEMPRVLYGVTVGLYLAFIGIMFAGLSSPGLVIPMVIFAVFIIAGFGVPAIWTKLATPGAQSGQKAMAYSEFKRQGLMTNTGHLSARDAAIQMLMLPVMIVCWGLFIVSVAALT